MSAARAWPTRVGDSSTPTVAWPRSARSRASPRKVAVVQTFLVPHTQNAGILRYVCPAQNAGGSSFKYDAALAIIVVVTLIALVPFVIAISNAIAPVAGTSAIKMGRAHLSQGYLP